MLPTISTPCLSPDGDSLSGYLSDTTARSTTRVFARFRSDGTGGWCVFVGDAIVATDYDMRGAYGFVN